ncbi:hypothetical protein [Carboxylicivirga sp. M1479]|uniref:hypothetical protein n=1 Tax=Carboxylicivirga sp. M1479 TaxID=2594476 RepID=UPI0011777225|nr:hypothetical protein [Carboxylicivirga sp. M1479]TRX66335.1 hypothetical protein FNN09_14100 [Carboxylicivirga sp. M1479]
MDEFKDQQLKSLLRESKVEMPFSDFESKLMWRVRTELVGKRSVIKNLRLSWLFFVLGSVFGIAVSITLPMFQISIGGLDFQLLKYPLLASVLFLIFWQLDGMIKFTTRQRNKENI